MRLFARHGFAGTSTDMVVAEAGGSKATLYKYFPTKDDLVRGLMDRVAASINRDHVDPELDEMPLAEALTRIGRSALDAICSEPAMAVYRLCIAELERFPELAKTVWKHGPAVTYANFKRFLEKRRERGELDFEDAQLAAEHFLAGIVGHLQPRRALRITAAPKPAERKRRVAVAVEVFLAAYGTGSE